MRNKVEEIRSLVHAGWRTHRMNDLCLGTRQHTNTSSRWHTLMNASSGRKRRGSCQQPRSARRLWPKTAATDGTDGANTAAEHKAMPANKRHWISMVATPPVVFFFLATEMAALDLPRPALAVHLIQVVFGCPTVALSKDQRQPGRTHHLPACKSRGLATGVVGCHFTHHLPAWKIRGVAIALVGHHFITHHLSAWKSRGLAIGVVDRHSRFNQFSPLLLAGQTQLLAP